jgi:UMF1 family MFS transporter
MDAQAAGPKSTEDRHATPWGQFAWALYEWARNPYILLVSIYLFVPYYANVMAGDPKDGQIALSWISGITGFAIALLAPALGAVADLGRGRKAWVAAYSFALAAGSFALWWAIPGGGGLSFFAIGALLVVNGILFEFSAVFHNAMLPAIVPEKRIAMVSGWGLAFGNAAGVLLFLAILFLFALPGTGVFGFLPDQPAFGIDRAAHEDSRLTGPLAAVWLLVFMIPFLLFTRDAPGEGLPVLQAMRRGPARVWSTIRTVSRYRNVATFLIARMFYNDGKTAVLTFGGAYAAATFSWGVLDMTAYAVILSVFAVFGGFFGGWLDERFGSRTAILISISGTALGLVLSLMVTPVSIFGLWRFGEGAAPRIHAGPFFETAPEMVYIAIVILVAIFITAAYANSRTMLARIAPRAKMAEFFGLYAFSGQATAFLAPIAIGLMTWATGDRALGLTAILFFLGAGLVLMPFVREEREAD